MFSLWYGVFVLLLGVPLCFLGAILFFYIYTDLRIRARKNAIEKVLPEFLHLTAANIRAGMPIDQALWSAIRPRFGVLAKEIEQVAKQNMIGTPLPQALTEFSKKYESKVLQRSISLIVEGLDAGSEIGDLLEKIALNIEDMQIRKESMAANVTTYIIFIAFAVLFAAPLLFAISIQLLRIVHALGGSVTGLDSPQMDINFSLSTDAVKENDFFIFCLLSLTITASMSTVIIAAIKTGDPRDAIKSIPLYIVISWGLFFVAQWGLGYVFGGLL